METKIIKTWRDPYEEGFSICKPKQIEIQEGLTVLIGCNGAGKTTLLENVKEQIEYTEKIPCLFFDNLSSGGSNFISEAIWKNNISMAATAYSSSEGEQIVLNVGRVVSQIQEFLQTGETAKTKERKMWQEIFGDGTEYTPITSKERWMFFDATDSGLSIDNIEDLKNLFHTILQDAKKYDVTIYILITANEYELARGENCFDVNAGKYLTFQDYEDYRKFILRSRELKNKRYERLKK